MRPKSGARMLVGFWAVGMLPLVTLATQAPVAAAGPTFGKAEKIGAPRSVVFRSLPPPEPRIHDSLQFHPRSASASAAAKQAARSGRTGRSAGVVPLAQAPASLSSQAPRTPASAGGGGTQSVGAPFVLTDRSAQIGWFPNPPLGQSQGVAPPDTQIAVGDTQLMEMVNDSASIWDKTTGAHLSHASLYTFFADPSRPSTAGITDPRVFYDSAVQRWFASALAFTNAGDSWVYLARSDGLDPGGPWKVYTDTATISHRIGTLQDQPKLGVTSDKVVMTWNDFNTSNLFTGSETIVIQKSDLVAGRPLTKSPMTNGPDPGRFNLIPVGVDNLTSTAYLVYSVFDNNARSLGRLGLISISGTPQSNDLVALERFVSITPTALPPGAEQPGGGPMLATNDDAFISAEISGTSLWVAGNDACVLPGSAAMRACVRLIQVSLATGPLSITQDVDIGQLGGHVFFPALALDAAHNLTLVFSRSSTTTYAGVATTGQPAGAIGTFAPISAFQTGLGVYNCGSLCGQGFNGVRWGDYGAAVLDPTSSAIWVAGEYAASATDPNDWGTAAAQVTFNSSVLKTAVSHSQYVLPDSNGANWAMMDPGQLALNFAPTATGFAILDANADLWTATAGINQDLGIFVATNGGSNTLVAWKESGGFAGTFSPNAAFVHHVMPVTAGSTYNVSLGWKSNKAATGATIFAGAGPIAGSFSPTRLTVRLVESGSSVKSVISNAQYIRSSGSNWADMDSANLSMDIPATPGYLAVISANADLWTVSAGFNQDLGIAVNGVVGAWKESGGFAGTYSPNAAFVQTVVDPSQAFHVSLQWKTNIATTGGQIRAGAGLPPQFSPTRLTVELVPSSRVWTMASAPATQYQLTGSDGNTWRSPDATVLHLAFTAPANCFALVSANADLWTASAGVNQDVGITLGAAATLSDGVLVHSPSVIAWKESGGFAGTFSPNAAYLQTVVPVASGLNYDLILQWKSNIPTGGTIVAGAGVGPNFSRTRITAQLICS